MDPASLYFLLGEFPFITQLYEYRREESRSDKHLSIDGIKELVLEARSRWLASRSSIGAQEVNWITPQLLQRYFQYIRNRTLLEHRLKPDLYTLVQAAQQIGGDAFALILLETAKTYDYQIDSSRLDIRPIISMGIGVLQDPGGEILPATNRLQGDPQAWRSLTLRPKPPILQKQSWAHQWNPYRQCSWPPEDQRIESFALVHVFLRRIIAMNRDSKPFDVNFAPTGGRQSCRPGPAELLLADSDVVSTAVRAHGIEINDADTRCPATCGKTSCKALT